MIFGTGSKFIVQWINVAKVERAATHYARYLADSEHEAIVRYKQALDET